MEHGDISNELPPRMLFVFEGLVAYCDQPRQEQASVKLRRWKRAANLWEYDSLILKHLWDLQFRRNFRLDCITFKGEPFGEALQEKFDRDYVPFSNVYAMNEAQLQRRLASMIDVVRVFDPIPIRALAWGRKGEYVNSAQPFNPLG